MIFENPDILDGNIKIVKNNKKTDLFNDKIEVINNKKKIKNLWFIHIPHTGGTFIRSYFHDQEFYNEFSYKSHECHAGFNSAQKFSEYYTFGVIRNPWDRLLGTWAWESRNRSKGKWDWTFNKFATHAPTLYVIDYHKIFCRKEINRPHELKLDYVVKFETLHEDIKKLLEINNLTMDISIDDFYEKNIENVGVRNHSEHEHYSKYYTTELIDLVYEQDKEIIEKFDYKFVEKFEEKSGFKQLPKSRYVVDITINEEN